MTGDPIADRILAMLREHPKQGITRTGINELFGGNKNTRQIQAALNLLAQLKLARSGKVKTLGRPTEIWAVVDTGGRATP
jgi:hypothetical protein